MNVRIAVLAAALAAVLLVHPAAADPPSSWQIARGEVRVTCPLTVGGSFEARTGAVTGTLVLATPRPATLTGGINVDLKTLDTGITLRNDHMREEYLEVGKDPGFDTAVLSEVRLDGADASFQGRTRFTATLLLHGTKRPVTGPAEIRRDAGGVRVEASFPVVLADYGIPVPRYLGVGVKNEVQVKASLTVAPVAVATDAR
jgi:polyisoprenoid-binding protein YceI